MQYFKKKNLFLFGMLLLLLPFFYLASFSNPIADDFVFSYYFQEKPLFNLLKDTYLGWNGRYTSNFLVFLNPLAFGSFYGYKLVLILNLLFLILSHYFFVRNFLYCFRIKDKLIFSLLLSVLFLSYLPIISEGIYWYTGAMVYSFGTGLSFFYFGFITLLFRSKRGIPFHFFLTFLLFLACGFNVVLTLLIVFFIAYSYFGIVYEDIKTKRQIKLQLFFALIFLAILVLSPGNWNRSSFYSGGQRFWYSTLYSFLQVCRFSLLWIFSIPLLLSSILFLDYFKKWEPKILKMFTRFKVNRWMSFFSLFLIVFIAVFPPYWATGTLGQHRTMNVAYAFFLPFWFFNLIVWVSYYNRSISFSLSILQRKWLCVSLLLSFIFIGNGYDALHSIFTGEAKLYSKQMDSRVKLLGSQPNHSVIFLEPLVRPKCLFFSDITDNPNDWKNKAYNVYFRTDSKLILKKNH